MENALNNIMDVAIVGAGPAGMTAALYLGRANKKVAIFDKEGYGGNIAKSHCVENIPGFKSISGMDFATNMFEQISNLSTVNYIMEEVVLLNYNHGLFKVSTSENKTIVCKSVIFATGTKFKTLNLPTENIYYCESCDGPFFKNKNVIVVGSGNTGATYALSLANYCKNVSICDITPQMCCEKILQDRILNTPNIKWYPQNTVKAVHNNKNNKLDAVYLTDGTEIKCSGIFAAIGQTPQTKVMGAFVKLSPTGYATSGAVPGVFIAGDCGNNPVKQVVTACSEGASAAIAVMNFLTTFLKGE